MSTDQIGGRVNSTSNRELLDALTTIFDGGLVVLVLGLLALLLLKIRRIRGLVPGRPAGQRPTRRRNRGDTAPAGLPPQAGGGDVRRVRRRLGWR
ncbi:MAG: hypothetical protein ACRDRH_26805 [Pseudonocardia sp.]